MAMDFVVDLDRSPSSFGYFIFAFLRWWKIPNDSFVFRILQKLLGRQLGHLASEVSNLLKTVWTGVVIKGSWVI